MATATIIRPGGRTSKNTDAILAAVISLIKSQGLSFTFDDVARDSGVTRRTLHRRWSGKMALIADALSSRYRDFTFPVTGDFAADLRTLAFCFREFCDDPLEIVINGLSAISTDSEFAQVNYESWMKIHPLQTNMIERAKAKGVIDPLTDTSTLLSMLQSPILLTATVLRTKMSDVEIDNLVRHVLLAAGYNQP